MPYICSLTSVILSSFVIVLGILFVYFNGSFDPQIYSLKEPPKLVGVLAPNKHLRNANLILKGQISGPESLLVEGNTIYTGTWDAKIVKIVDGVIKQTIRLTNETVCGTFDTEPICGRPLGIRRLNKDLLVVADAYLGIYTLDFAQGKWKQVYSTKQKINGESISFVNDLDVLDENTVFFTDSSSKWDRRRFLHSFMEAKPDGRVFRLDIASGDVKVIMDKLYFANGLQLFPDKQSFIVSECSMSRIKSMTGSYLSESFQFYSKVLAVETFLDKHSGDNIADKINSILTNLGIQKDNVVAATRDGAPNLAGTKGGGCAKANIESYHCFCHMLHLVVWDGINNAPIVSEVVEKASKIGIGFHRTPTAMAAFRKIQGDASTTLTVASYQNASLSCYTFFVRKLSEHLKTVYGEFAVKMNESLEARTRDLLNQSEVGFAAFLDPRLSYKFYFAGAKKETQEIFVDNLPGLPDNIRLSHTNTFYVGLAGVRHSDEFSLVDKLGDLPWLRKLLIEIIPERYLAKLFTLVKRKYGIAIELDQAGQIISAPQDPDGLIVTDASQVSDDATHLYLGSFHADFIAKVPKKGL